MSYLDNLPSDLKTKIYELRLQRQLEPLYYNKIKCYPNKDINRLTKDDIIDCIIERYIFIKSKYIYLQGRTRYKYVINGYFFINLMANLMELTPKLKLPKNKVIEFINRTLKTYKLSDLMLRKYKNDINYRELEEILTLTPDVEEDETLLNEYVNLSKEDIYNILNIFNKNVLKDLYTVLNNLFKEEAGVY